MTPAAGSQTAYRPVSPISAPSIRPLLHPTEPSRFALAILASLVALGLPLLVIISAGTAAIFLLLLALGFFLASIWFGMQIGKARLLGRSVRVDERSFPLLQGVIDEVRSTLGYQRRLEIYVCRTGGVEISSTSLLGTRIVLIDGDLLAELSEPAKLPQLKFLIGSHVGAMRARHDRVELLVLIMGWAEVLKYVNLLILPYYRATAYSGDQIGATCCANVHAALEVTRRLLVGPKTAGSLHDGAVMPQAMLVKNRILPRLVQLVMPSPHITNRYANLLCFARYHDPDWWQALRDGMSELEAHQLDAIWRRSPYARVPGV
jgi:hypothetical protein